MQMTLASDSSLIARVCHYAGHDPTRVALACDSGILSYGALASQIDHWAARLVKLNVDQASVVIFDRIGDLEHLMATLACLHLGASTGSAEVAHIRGMHNAQQVSGTALPEISLDPASHDPAPIAASNLPDAALLFATSGTSGSAKLVELLSADIVAQAARHVPDHNTRFACLAPISHNFSKRHRLYCLAQGATNVFVDTRPAQLVESCLALGVSTLHVTAYQAHELLGRPDAHRLCHIQLKLGGSHVPPDLRQALRSRITANTVFGYGTTETGAIAFTAPDDTDAVSSVGKPLPGIEVAILDDNGQALPAGESGEITIRGAGMFRGYLSQPELTKQRLRAGWFHTGDVGRVDAAGRLHVDGRVDDMFVFNSWNIYPQAIEADICSQPGVSDAAVLPMPSEVHGDIPVALVVLDAGTPADLNTLQQSLREQLGMRSPRIIQCADSIPRNAGGKIQRQAALALFKTLRAQDT